MGSTGSRRKVSPAIPRPPSQPLSRDEASVRASLLGGYQRIPDDDFNPVEHLAQEAAYARRRFHYTAKLASCCCNTRDFMGNLCSCQTVLTVILLLIVGMVVWFHWDQIGPAGSAARNVTKAIHRMATTTTTTTTTTVAPKTGTYE